MSAINDVITRAQCIVDDGDCDNVHDVISEAYELEYRDSFLWDLLETVFNPSDLISPDVEDELLNYITAQTGDEIQDMLDEAEQAREDEEVAVQTYYDLAIDEEYGQLIGNRERDVFDNLASVERYLEGPGHWLYQFFHKDGEHSCTWDDKQKRFVN